MSIGVVKKLEEYKNLLDFNDEYYGKDFKSNYKFVTWAVNKMRKNKTAEEEICIFIQDTIDIHINIYL